MIEPVDLVEDRLFDGLGQLVLVYTDHYRGICVQYARFRDAFEGIRAPEPYP